MKKLVYLLVIIWTLLGLPYSFASSELIEVKARDFTLSLEKHLKLIKSRLPDDPNAIRTVIEEVVLPNVDTRYFAYKILGKHASQMTNEQKETFKELLKVSMINNYIAVLKHYNNEALLLETVRKSESGKTAKALIKVSANIDVNTKAKKLVLVWRYNKEIGTWNIYDLEAEGISLLQSKQKEIASVINQHGSENMLTLLETKSNKLTKPNG